jgi:hypothetical protein
VDPVSGTDVARAEGFGKSSDTVTVIPPAGIAGTGWSIDAAFGLIATGAVVTGDTPTLPYNGIDGSIWLDGGIPQTNVPGVSENIFCRTAGLCDFTLDLGIFLSSSNPTFGLNMLLDASVTNSGFADALDTGQAFLTLPDGYSFTSASGFFNGFVLRA